MSVDDVARAASCLADGARGVIAIDDDAREVMTAVHAAAEGGVSLSARIARAIGDALIGSIDATERLGAELEGLRDSVAQGTSAKADFLSNISHELRTPVTVAKGIAYVLNNPSIGEDERTEFLGELQGSLDKLMGLVDEIITMSELERGTFELRLAEVDLAPAVDRAVAVARDQHPTIRIEVIRRGATAHPRRRGTPRGGRRRAAGQRVPVLPRRDARPRVGALDVRGDRRERHRSGGRP